MSALPPKADIIPHCIKCPLIAKSGHSALEEPAVANRPLFLAYQMDNWLNVGIAFIHLHLSARLQTFGYVPKVAISFDESISTADADVFQ